MQRRQKTTASGMFSTKKEKGGFRKDSKRRTNLEAKSGGNVQRNSANSASSNPPSENNSTKRSGFFRPFSKPPTIIRANEQSSNNAKKRRPPRPPPPKFNSSGCVSAFSLDPPSYEEVLRADAKANRQKRPAPPLPQTSRINASNPTTDSTLIDFGANETPQMSLPAAFQSQEFRELEDIFSDWNIGRPNNSVINNNNLTNILEQPTGSDDLLNDDIYLSGGELFATRTTVERTSRREMPERPVPLPRSSLAASSVGGNRNELPRTVNQHNGFSETSFENPPSLPPRPVMMNSLIEDATETELPAIPPKPQHYNDSSQGSDIDVSYQRVEPHGIALFDYTASQNDELSFKINDTIILIHRIDNDWFYGCSGELEGMFPRTFFQVVIPLPDDPEFQNEGDALPSGPRCLAMFDYVSDSEEELTFHVGDMISVVARINEHWLMGEFKGKSGLVPANYVRIIEDLPTNGSAICEATVLHDFKADLASELDCKVGDHVTIITPVDKDWVKAQNGTRIGIIPWTYLNFSI